MPFHTHTLSNGLKIIAEITPSARSAALGFYVRTGSRDETPEVSGVSHFLEHMVFKGTPRRSALEVNIDFDRIGANYNAYTSEENTVFYAAVLPEYLPQAVDILADILRPSLREEDFDMEKKVIIEEIGMYDDMPGFCAYDGARRVYFGEHPLGNSILGTADSIRALTRAQMLGYFEKRYVAPNITVASAGNIDFSEFVSLVERHCVSWPAAKAPRKLVREVSGTGAFKVVTKSKVAQEYVLTISAGPPTTSPLRYSADVLSMILGDETGSRLYWALVDPGHAESADMGFHEYDGTGAFYTSFSGTPQRTKKNLAVVRKILEDVQRDSVTEAELQQAKSKVLSRVVRQGERPMGRMQAIAAAWTYQKKYRSVDDELEGYEAVSLKTIRKVLDRYPLDQGTTFAYGPLKKLPGAT